MFQPKIIMTKVQQTILILTPLYYNKNITNYYIISIFRSKTVN